MKTILFTMFQLGVLSLLLPATTAYGAVIQIDINTSSLSGRSGQIAFDLIDGGTPSNTITIANLITDGVMGATSNTGDITGALPSHVTLRDTSFFNEYLLGIMLGTKVSFLLDDTAHAPNVGSFPDGFSVFLLDPTTGLPLFATSDPTGSDALFLLSIGTTTGLEVYSGQNFSVSVRSIPEPSLLYLVATLLGVMGVFISWRHRPKRLKA